LARKDKESRNNAPLNEYVEALALEGDVVVQWPKENEGPDDLKLPYRQEVPEEAESLKDEDRDIELRKRNNEFCRADNEPELEVMINQQDPICELNSKRKFVQDEQYGSVSPNVRLEERAPASWFGSCMGCLSVEHTSAFENNKIPGH